MKKRKGGGISSPDSKAGISTPPTQMTWTSNPPGEELSKQLVINAPLTRPYLQALLEGRRLAWRRGIRPTFRTPLEQETGYLEEEWKELHKEVARVRPALFQILFLLRNQEGVQDTQWLSHILSREWLVQAVHHISALSPPIPIDVLPPFPAHVIAKTTLTDWRRRGLVHYTERNRPDWRCLPPLMMALLLDERRNKFLYSFSTSATPDCDLWGAVQPPPTEGVERRFFPWPISRLKEVPASHLVVFAWAGAIWDRPLLKWNSTGALGFNSAIQTAEQVRWGITLADIQAWDGDIASLYEPLPGAEDEVVQWLANLTLVRQASALFAAHNLAI